MTANKPEYALSLQPPWGILVCINVKNCENREWRSNYKGRVYIHQSNCWGRDAMNTIMHIDYSAWLYLLNHQPEAHWYGIIGETTFGECTDFIKSPWFFGKYAYPCFDGILYEKPILCPGHLGFFKPEITG